MSAPIWRFLRDGPADGAANMARDESLLRSAERGASPTLRLYAWTRPTLSLGAHQPSSDVDRPACRSLGVDLVRRPTGGAAVLHDREITYAVAGRLGEGAFPASVIGVYEQIAAALIAGLGLLGVRAEAGTLAPGGRAPADCFARASIRELLVGGRKLAGSAQLRRGRTFLQHGSILIDFDAARLERVLPGGENSRDMGAQQQRDASEPPATLGEQLGERVSRTEIEQAIAEGFRRALRVQLEPGEFEEAEAADAALLRTHKYLDALWTLEGKLRVPQ